MSRLLPVALPLICVLASLVLPSLCIAADDVAGRIEGVVQSYHERGTFDGAILVIEDNEVVYADGFGPANRTWDIDNAADTKFHICSITKQFTAVLVLQLVAEERLTLDDSISDHLSWYRKDTGSAITIKQLLQHMSGLPEPITEFDQLDDAMAVADTPRQLIEQFASGDLLFEPGTAFNYSNADYYVLGTVIEAVTGMSFEQALRERILDPLDMNDTGMRRFEDVVPNMASGYQQADGTFEHRIGFGQLGYAAAGMYSTVEDLGKWNLALLQHRVLSRELTEVMYTPAILPGQSGSYVGLGSWIYNRPLPPDNAVAPRLVERRGYITPFTGLNVLCPDDGHAFVILSNADPCDIHRLPFANGMPLDLLLVLYDRDPAGPPR
jgi:CubicO group peptidase (beta-lactamase class C family)